MVETQSCVHIIYVLQKCEEVLHLLKCQPLGQRKESFMVMGKQDRDTTWIMKDKVTHQPTARGEFVCTLKTPLPWFLKIWFMACTFMNCLCSPPDLTSGVTRRDFPMHCQRPKKHFSGLAPQLTLPLKRHPRSLWLGCRRSPEAGPSEACTLATTIMKYFTCCKISPKRLRHP